MWQRLKNIYHLLQSITASLVFGFPSRDLILIGVTGTDGKTTTVNLIFHILKSAGKTASMVSTIGANIHGKSFPLGFHVTNPSAFPLQKFLSEAKKIKKGEKNYMVLEVTSHGLDQNRVWGLPFEIGVITNVTPEHTDYHKTYDNYLKTKVKLLKMSKSAILNKDDASYLKIIKLLKNKKITTYGINEGDINPKKISYTSNLIGQFNEYNILAAVSVCRALGVTDSKIKEGIKTFEAPLGRMNKIQNNRGLKIYIDYAHTANGVKEAISALNNKKENKLISLIGAEGYRDENKRSVMGETAVKLSDYVVITSVDPRGLADQINKQILEGVKMAGGVVGKNVFVENDRSKAIDFAINKLARKGDTVGIFGKGHERSMNLDGKNEIPWSDFDEVKIALSNKNYGLQK